MLPQLRENRGTSGNAVKVGLVNGSNFKYQRGNNPPINYALDWEQEFYSFLLLSFLLLFMDNSADWVQKDHAKEQKMTHEISFGVANFKAK